MSEIDNNIKLCNLRGKKCLTRRCLTKKCVTCDEVRRQQQMLHDYGVDNGKWKTLNGENMRLSKCIPFGCELANRHDNLLDINKCPLSNEECIPSELARHFSR